MAAARWGTEGGGGGGVGERRRWGGGWGKKRREINQVGAICGRWACCSVISNPVTLAALTKRTASAGRLWGQRGILIPTLAGDMQHIPLH